MFGITKRLDNIEDAVATSLRDLHDKDWRIQQLERELQDLKAWGTKWREKAKYLRRKNRQLRTQIKELTP